MDDWVVASVWRKGKKTEDRLIYRTSMKAAQQRPETDKRLLICLFLSRHARNSTLLLRFSLEITYF